MKPAAAFGLALLWMVPEAWAEEQDTIGPATPANWTCALCPAPGGWNGEIEAGPGWVSDSSLKFGDYRGLAEKGLFAAIDGDVHYRGADGRFLDLRMRQLGIDSRSFDLRGGERGRYALELGYREIPKYRGFGAQTVYLGSGGGELTLPNGWQPGRVTQDMTALDASLQTAELEIARKTLDLGFSWRLAPRWTWDIDLQHQDKKGTRPFGAGVFTINSSQFPAPVDFSTNRLDTSLNYSGSRASWRLGFSGSEFNNEYDSITWQNPFIPLPGTEFLRASLEPDNSYYRFDLAGTWEAAGWLRLGGTAAAGRMKQDDPLLPFSINPNFSELPLPRATADTRIDLGTIDLAGKLDARLTRDLSLVGRWRFDKRDNETPVDLWTPVITDLVERGPRPNRPYSFQRNNATLALKYRASRIVRLQAGAEFDQVERTLQSVEETEETGYWGELSLGNGSLTEFRLFLERYRVDAGPYIQLGDAGLDEHPLMRKFHLADREGDRQRIDVDIFPLPQLTLTASYQHNQVDYEHSAIGLLEGDERTLSLDLGWNVSERVNAHAFFSRDDIDSSMAGAQFPGLAPWLGVTDDRFLTAGVGVQARVSPRLEWGFEVVSADSDGNIRTTDGASGGPFPTLETDLLNLRLHLDYRTAGRWGIRTSVEYEKYDSSNWAIDGLGPAGIPSILTFGMESPDYSVLVLRVQGSYRF